MKWSCDTAFVILGTDGTVAAEANEDALWESSSTIKVPILLLTLQKMTSNKTKLTDTLPRLPHHDTTGSGIFNLDR